MHGVVQRKLARLGRLEAAAARLREQLGASALVEVAPALQRGLSKREALLVEAERVAHLGSWVWDLRTDEIGWSDEFYRILGLSQSEVTPSSEAFFRALHDDDRERAREIIARSFETGRPEPIECRLVRPDGDVRQVRVEAAFLHDERGERVHVVGTVLDETERLRAAALLAETVRDLDDAQRIAGLGSWRWDPRTRRVECSKGLFRLLDLPAATEASVALLYRHVHPQDRRRVQRALHTAMQSGSPASLEFRARRGSATRYATMELHPVRDSAGKPEGWHAVVQDVSERKAFEEQLLHSQKMEAVGTLAGGVAHDFNNYLTVIGSHSELAEELVPEDGAARESISAIREACERCTRLTRQLLTLSRKRMCEPRRVSLTAVVEQLLPMVRVVLGATISVRPSLSRRPTQIVADPLQIEQVLMNLVLNARDAMPEGGELTIAVRSGSSEAGNGRAESGRRGRVCLLVADTGVGMPQEVAARIFEPFFTTKSVGRGTGLGLSTVYGIVQQADGTIEVESKPHSGSTFRLWFSSAAEGPEALANQASPVSAHGRGRRVLVVEDVEGIRDLLCSQLRRAGYTARGAQDGIEALRMLQQERADLVVSDIVMPNMGGLELMRELRAHYPGVRRLLMTGYSDEALRGAPLEQVLHKPFTGSDLLGAVAQLLGDLPRVAEL